MNARRCTLLAVAAAALLAGCSRGAEAVEPYRLEPTRECLLESDLRVGRPPANDFVATTATGGALLVTYADIRLTLTFGEDDAEAGRLDQAYRRFAPRRLPIDDVLRRNRNVVELWEFAPTIDHQDTLNRCLRS
jgi:hypothetical protein